VGDIIFEDNIPFEWQAETFRQRLLPQVACAFVEICGGGPDPAAGVGEAVVVDDESALVVVNVRVAKTFSSTPPSERYRS
jgi:hypothetical protein